MNWNWMNVWFINLFSHLSIFYKYMFTKDRWYTPNIFLYFLETKINIISDIKDKFKTGTVNIATACYVMDPRGETSTITFLNQYNLLLF